MNDEPRFVISLLDREPEANEESSFGTLEEAAAAALKMAIYDREPWAIYDDGELIAIAYDFEIYRKR